MTPERPSAPELPTGYLDDGEPSYADHQLDDAYQAFERSVVIPALGELETHDRHLDEAAFLLSAYPEGRALWPEWRRLVDALVERNTRRASDLAEHEARILAELEPGADAAP
jgi:hypothetical protein